MKSMSANRIDPDGTQRFAASHLGLFCLPVSNKKSVRLIWVNTNCVTKAHITGANSHAQALSKEQKNRVCKFELSCMAVLGY